MYDYEEMSLLIESVVFSDDMLYITESFDEFVDRVITRIKEIVDKIKYLINEALLDKLRRVNAGAFYVLEYDYIVLNSSKVMVNDLIRCWNLVKAGRSDDAAERINNGEFYKTYIKKSSKSIDFAEGHRRVKLPKSRLLALISDTEKNMDTLLRVMPEANGLRGSQRRDAEKNWDDDAKFVYNSCNMWVGEVWAAIKNLKDTNVMLSDDFL